MCVQLGRQINSATSLQTKTLALLSVLLSYIQIFNIKNIFYWLFIYKIGKRKKNYHSKKIIFLGNQYIRKVKTFNNRTEENSASKTNENKKKKSMKTIHHLVLKN